METVEARVEVVDGKHVITIQPGEVDQDEIAIPMSDDDPKEVKAAFNKLILRIKVGSFRIQLEDPGEDLFSQVADEYITQLNREIREVHSEMREYGLANA